MEVSDHVGLMDDDLAAFRAACGLLNQPLDRVRVINAFNDEQAARLSNWAQSERCYGRAAVGLMRLELREVAGMPVVVDSEHAGLFLRASDQEKLERLV
jgi:L-rhamnose isomerase